MDLQAWASFLTMLPAAVAVQSIVYKIILLCLRLCLIPINNWFQYQTAVYYSN